MAQKVAGLYVKLDADSAKLVSELRKSINETRKLGKTVNREANRVKYAFNKIRRAAQVVASAFIFTAGIRQLGRMVAAVEMAEERLSLMRVRMEQFSRSGGDGFQEIYELSQELGTSLETTAQGMTRLLIATKSIGTSAEDLEDVHRTIVLLGRAGGTSAEEMKGALIQLSQGMASGRLQGEELRSVLENLPLVAMEIAQELDSDIGKIRELAAEGKITTDVIVRALRETQVGVEALPETFSMATARMRTEWDLLLETLGKQLDSSGILDGVTGAIAWLREFASSGDDLSGFSDEQLRAAFAGGGVSAETLRAINVELEKRRLATERLAAAEKARAEAAKLAEEAARIAREAQFADATSAALKAKTTFLKKEFQNLWAEFEQIAEDEDFLSEEIPMRIGKLPPTMKKATDEMSEYAKQAARNIQDAFAEFLFDPFEDGVKGMLESFLTAIRRMLANQLALQWFGPESGIGKFFASLSGRASGGPVTGGTPYIVGERGPELFMPSQSGTIIPNHRLATAGGVSITNNFAAGADVATIRAEIIPMLEATQRASVAEVMHRRREGNL